MEKEKKGPTAKELMNQKPEDVEKQELQDNLEDAATDLNRAIRDGEKELSKSDKALNRAVKAYVLGGEIGDLLKIEQNRNAKKEDVASLKRIQEQYFPEDEEK